MYPLELYTRLTREVYMLLRALIRQMRDGVVRCGLFHFRIPDKAPLLFILKGSKRHRSINPSWQQESGRQLAPSLVIDHHQLAQTRKVKM